MARFDRKTAYLPAVVSWDNWGSFFLDLEMWRPVVHTVCRCAGLGPADRVVAGYPGTCAVFIVDDRVVLKFYPPMLPDDYSKEREAYRLMSPALDVLPKVLDEGVYPDRIDWPYLVTAHVAGVPLREARVHLGRRDLRRVANDIGPIISTIHGTVLGNSTVFGSPADEWQSFLRSRISRCAEELDADGRLPETMRAIIRNYLVDKAGVLESSKARICLVHADLTEDHLLVSRGRDGWRVSGLIDWADAQVGPPDYDWVALGLDACRRDADFFAAIISAYDPGSIIDSALRTRLFDFTLLHRFAPGILHAVWERDGKPTIGSIGEMIDWIWPPTLERSSG